MQPNFKERFETEKKDISSEATGASFVVGGLFISIWLFNK